VNIIDRLRELLANGERRQAETFAKEALRNEPVTVDCAADRVVVETETFRGEHPLERPFDRTDPEAVRAAIGRRGSYRLREDPDLLRFDCGIPHEAVVQAVVAPPEDPGDAADEASPTDDPSETEPESLLERTVAAVGRLRGRG
jgi:hypothetical protein